MLFFVLQHAAVERPSIARRAIFHFAFIIVSIFYLFIILYVAQIYAIFRESTN